MPAPTYNLNSTGVDLNSLISNVTTRGGSNPYIAGLPEEANFFINDFANSFKTKFGRDPQLTEVNEAMKYYVPNGADVGSSVTNAIRVFSDKYNPEQPTVGKDGTVKSNAQADIDAEIQGYIDYFDQNYVYPALSEEERSARELEKQEAYKQYDEEGKIQEGQVKDVAFSGGNAGTALEMDALKKVNEETQRKKDLYLAKLQGEDYKSRYNVTTAKQAAIQRLLEQQLAQKYQRENLGKYYDYMGTQSTLNRDAERDIASANNKMELLGVAGNVAGSMGTAYTMGKMARGEPLFPMFSKPGMTAVTRMNPVTGEPMQVMATTKGGGLGASIAAHPYLWGAGAAVGAYQIPAVRRAVQKIFRGRSSGGLFG